MIGDSADRRVEILCDRDELHVTWSRFGPQRDGAGLHVHRQHTDLFYVLTGELTVMLGASGAESVAQAGSVVIAPPLVVHGFRNGSDAELCYLNFHAPGAGFADYLRGRRDGVEVAFDSEDPPADGGRPAQEALIVPAEQGPLLAGRDETRIEVRDEPAPASKRLTCLYALEAELATLAGGRFLQIQA